MAESFRLDYCSCSRIAWRVQKNPTEKVTALTEGTLDLSNSIGRKCRERLGDLLGWLFYVMTMLYSFAVEVVRPSTWQRPVRDRLARQILFTGVEAAPFTILVALFVGGSVFVQCLVWLRYTGQMEFLTEIVSALLVREASPFLASFIVIAASASAMTTELANMKISGQVALLESQGINLFRYLAVPRMLGLGLSVMVLSVIFATVALLASAIGFFMDSNQIHGAFFGGVFASLDVVDLFTLLGKSFLPGLATGAICCYEGLRVTGATTAVPKAVSQAMLRSVSAGAFIWVIVLIFTFAL